ncbi:hypothetical protein [Hymenobacter sp. BT190]|uniref:hypothetical protein n=1 Tax=Hymenobacter sp. BT190 TaxID=2763505 RepID=UPI0016518B31|nr:hypothetical protein [Hymenobacter sp. BT190]MBC6698708.1 hypothetical protein [Hymenobacter sp. BT190]
MTRASLLHILDHVGGISEAETRELEQLAAAFPYCQSAHILLAKAAHDRGSMLASQRLRRAATYAADRQLLRQLLEQPVQERLAAPAPQHLVGAPSAPQPAPTPGNTAAFLQTLEPEDVLPLENTPEEVSADGSSATLVTEEAPVATTTVAPAETETLPVSEPPTEKVAEVLPDTAEPAATTADPTSQPAVEAAAPVETAAETVTSLIEGTNAAAATSEPEAVADSLAATAAPAVASAQPTAVASAPAATAVADASNEPVLAAEELLPPVAPPIRPPAEAGISRFEFGLAEAETLPAPSSYQLTGDTADEEEDDVLARLLPPVPKPVVPAFHSDAALAYALLGGGSRLGYALQMQDGELTTGLPTDEFFEPDALLQAHAAAHQPKRRPARSSLTLIDQFLKNQPRLKSAAKRPAPTEEQADLSVRSTSVVPQLASESLAKIMVKQGKIDKAIEIYERLMVRQPEKSAYFTDQIQQLQTPE